MVWTDTLMLGYFDNSQIVGLYNGATNLAHFIPIGLTSVAFIFVPIASELYSKHRNHEIGRTYQITAKWIFLLTIPIFFILFLFPETVTKTVYGAEYVASSLSLQILCIGFMFHTSLGLNGMTLIVFGKTNFLLVSSLIGVCANIVLNIFLIPLLGIVGAALASLLSYSMVNLLRSLYLYKISKIHPFTRGYIKPILIAGILMGFIYYLTTIIAIKIWMLPLLLLLFLFLFFMIVLVTSSLDKDDVSLLYIIEKKSGLKLTKVITIVEKYIH